MRKKTRTSQRLLWLFMTVIIIGVVTIGILTNLTLRSIEKNLPITLITELNDLSTALENLAALVHVAEMNKNRPSPARMRLMKANVERVYTDIIDLRESYVFDNLVKASAFHNVVAPAIADLQIWLDEGISGYAPDSSTTAAIVFARIRGAHQSAQLLVHDAKKNARRILEQQKERLDRFLLNVNLLFVLAIVCTFSIVYLSFRQHFIEQREFFARVELEKQRDLLNNLFDNVFLGIMVWGPSGHLEFINRGFKKITGYAARDIQTQAEWMRNAYPEGSYRERVTAAWKAAKNQEKAIREFKITCRDGREKEIEFRGTFLSDGRELVTLADITRKREAERIIRESREIKARSKKMESLGLLAGGVAHDLNNILTGIVSYPELLLIDLPEESPLRKPLQTIQASGLRAAATVLDLLTIARGVATVKAPIDINRSILEYLQSPEFDKLRQSYDGIEIQTVLDRNLFSIHGSQAHIRKVVMNLVSNAIEAVGDRGRIKIETLNRYIDKPFQGYDDIVEGEYVVLSVTDNGPGISESDMERIFEPFYTKKMMGRSGTGLGLAVVWNVVQDHNGYIDLRSANHQTVFDLYFPATREAASDDASRRPVEDYLGNGETVLIVDDVGNQREIASKMLQKLGYKTQTAASGEEAVAYVQEHDVDLIVLDMIMAPGINGRETYERIARMNPGQKAIIASGFAETRQVKLTQRLGAGRFLKKPFTLEALGVAVKEELEKASG